MDLLCSQLDNNYLKSLFEYKYWINCRNSILNSDFNSFQCDIYDEKIAESGSILSFHRSEVIVSIRSLFISLFQQILGKKVDIEIRYDSIINAGKYSIQESKNVFYRQLGEIRKKDLQLGFTSVGPHRDNVQLFFNSYDAKTICSQGQCRAIALSLKLSMSELLYNVNNEKLLFLIDDAVSELDSEKTVLFFKMIENKGQIIVATPQGKSSFTDFSQIISL